LFFGQRFKVGLFFIGRIFGFLGFLMSFLFDFRLVARVNLYDIVFILLVLGLIF